MFLLTMNLSIVCAHITCAVGGIQMGCGHKYGFANECEDDHATETHKFTPLELKSFVQVILLLICTSHFATHSFMRVILPLIHL